MKALLPRLIAHALVIGCLLGGKLLAQDTFTPFAGTYQGLLVETVGGEPAGQIDFTLTSKGSLSGSLLLKDQKSYKFKSEVRLDEISNSARLTHFDVVKPKEELELTLSLVIGVDGSFSVEGDALLPNFNGSFVHREDSAARLRFYKAKTDDCPWTGVYTMAFHDAVSNGDETPPGGATIGSATVKPDGVMSVKGTLADGTKFTASARPSEDGTYRFFFSVHKTAGSYFTALFRLTDRGDDWFHVADGEGSARWAKSPNEKDKSYRDGFDASLEASVVEWKAPGSGETVSGLLGVDIYNYLAVEFFEGLSTETYAAFLPTKLGLTSKNTFLVAESDGGPSAQDQAAWSKIFSGKVDPKTGLITVTINITDSVAGKTIKRKVTLNGLFVQLENDLLEEPYAFGHLLIPPLDPKTQTLTSGGFSLPGPIQPDPLFASAGNTPGTYTCVLEEQEHPSPRPSKAPADGARITFTISPNLREMVFNGRKISLSGDSRPVTMSFTDVTVTPLNSLTVIVTLNGSGQVNDVFATYNQLGFPVKVREFISNNVTKQ